MTQSLIPLVLQVFVLFSFVGLTHHLGQKNEKYGSTLVISLLTIIMVIVQWISDIGAITFYKSYPLFISSVVFFPAILLGLFWIFVFDGPVLTRKLFYSLILGGIFYVISAAFLQLLGQAPSYLALNKPWLMNHLFSTLAVVADFYFITFLWSLFSKTEKYLLPKIAIVLLGATWIDTIVFVFGAFWGNTSLLSILYTDLTTRFFLSLLITPVAYFYLVFQIKNNNFQLQKRFPWSVNETALEVSAELNEAAKKIEELEMVKEELTEMSLVANKTISGVVILDSEGKIRWVNDGFLNITGYSIEDVQNKRRTDIMSGADTKKKSLEAFNHNIAEGKPFSLEMLNYKKDLSQVWLYLSVTPIIEDGKIHKYILVESDITPIKKSKFELEDKNRELADANERLEEANSMMLGRELKMIELKKEIEKLKGNKQI